MVTLHRVSVEDEDKALEILYVISPNPSFKKSGNPNYSIGNGWSKATHCY
jgi:hypothetical protein